MARRGGGRKTGAMPSMSKAQKGAAWGKMKPPTTPGADVTMSNKARATQSYLKPAGGKAFVPNPIMGTPGVSPMAKQAKARPSAPMRSGSMK
jgi:hypothetical protein